MKTINYNYRQIISYIVLALIPWLMVLLASWRGFDLTDEAFYLLNYRQPTDVVITPTLFGLLLSPLYHLSGSVVMLRIMGVLIWFVVATLTTWWTLRFLTVQLRLTNQSNWSLFLLTLPPIAGAALYYYMMVMTPSYNWLNLVSVTLFWLGFLMWLDCNQSATIKATGAMIVGFSAMVVFWTKPSSASLLPIFPMVALIVNRADWQRLLKSQTVFGGIIGFVIALSIPFLQGFTPQTLVEIFSRGLEHQQLMKPKLYDAASEVFLIHVREGVFFVTRNPYLPVLGLFIIIYVAVFWGKFRFRSRRNNLRWVQYFLVLMWVTNLVLMTFFAWIKVGYWGLNAFLSTLVFVWIGHLSYEKVNQSLHHDNRERFWKGLWIIPVIGLIFVFVFGTGVGYAHQTGLATYFYLLSSVVFLLIFCDNPINTLLTRISVPTLLLAIIVVLYTHSLIPYRQNESIWAMNYPIVLNDEAGTILVSQETARYFTELKTLADTAGFQPGTSLIDLTGDTPGAIYALEAQAYGFPWLLGDYDGSDLAAIYILQQWKAEQLNQAWLLTVEANGRVPLSPSILSEVGLDFPDGYIKVGTVRRADSQEVQALWQPVNKP